MLTLVDPTAVHSGHPYFILRLIIKSNTVIPLKFIRKTFNFLLSSLIFISSPLQKCLHLSKSQRCYFDLQKTCATVSGKLLINYKRWIDGWIFDFGEAQLDFQSLPSTCACLTLCSLSTFVLRTRQNRSQTDGLKPSGMFSGASSSSMAFNILQNASGARELHR